MSKDQAQKVQLQSKVVRRIAMDGVQVKSDGYQLVTSGSQVSMEGLQRGNLQRTSGLQPKGYGHQTTPSASPQRTFAPANGPKVPPKKS